MSNLQTNIVIFGKNGQISSNLIKLFQLENEFNVRVYSSNEADFSDLQSLEKFLNQISPIADFIINAAAYTKQACQSSGNQARRRHGQSQGAEPKRIVQMTHFLS